MRSYVNQKYLPMFLHTKVIWALIKWKSQDPSEEESDKSSLIFKTGAFWELSAPRNFPRKERIVGFAIYKLKTINSLNAKAVII